MNNLKEFYEKIGGNLSEVLGRFPNVTILEHFLGKYAKDPTFENFLNALDKKDLENAFLSAHTLKGIALNLGFGNLQSAASELTESLRSREKMPDAALVELLKKEQNTILDALKASE